MCVCVSKVYEWGENDLLSGVEYVLRRNLTKVLSYIRCI